MRWQEAQNAELKHWISAEESPSVKEARSVETANFLPFLSFLKGKISLDVGGGVYPFVRFMPGLKFYTDPLFNEYCKNPLLNPSVNYPGIAYKQGKAEALDYPSGFFTSVICKNVIDHTEDPAKCLSEMRRVLNDDGRLLLSVNVHYGITAELKKLAEKLGFFNEQPHPFIYTPEDICHLVYRSGFEIIVCAYCNNHKLKSNRLLGFLYKLLKSETDEIVLICTKDRGYHGK